MKIFYILIFVFSFSLDARDFKVASYNVENLFDLHYDRTEYKEYRPYTKTWNPKALTKKIDNISQVINALDADIIGLQEIESQKALNNLLKKIPKYKYHTFVKKKTASVGVALLSVFPIKKIKKIDVNKRDDYSRYILKVTLLIENKDLIIYVNHWRSKRAAESQRIIYALALKKELTSLKSDQDYIILGDLNANYNEYQTFKYNKNLNDTFGITGINQILNTTEEGNLIHIRDMLTLNKQIHYNLWLELKDGKFSTLFKGELNTPDNILLPKGLFDTKGISYVQNSFGVFKPNYLFKNKKITSWNRYKKSGYSDHLPVYALFSTDLQKFIVKKTLQNQTNTIQNLYTIQTIDNYPLQNIIVIYKSDNIAIIQRKNDRAIMIFRPSKELQLGYMYNATVDKIDLFYGLKEIKKLSHIQKLHKVNNYTDYYLDGNKINIFNKRYQNSIIKNISGVYKKRYLYFKKGDKEFKIRLYFAKKLKRPKNGKKITINSGHLSVYKSKIQIVLHSKKDFTMHTQGI